MATRTLREGLPTGLSWLSRGLAASAFVHLLGVIVMVWVMKPAEHHEVEIVDIELAPPPPKAEALPAEVAKPPEAEPKGSAEDTTPASTTQEPDKLEGSTDAGVDAPADGTKPPDAAPDAAPDAEPMVASSDGGGGDASELFAIGSGSGSGSGVGSAAGSGSGVPAAIAQGSGSGAPGADDQPQVDGAPTTAGTAANLLAYFPPGHVVTALVRFDRLRGTEWAAITEKLFRPMPDYHALFGDRDAGISAKLDLLVISSPRPRDATATTLVMHTQQSRSAVRDLLASSSAPITWSAAKGGLFGKRSGAVFPGDRRVLLSPWKTWYLLAQPDDLAGLTAAATGNLDAIEAKAKLPAWLSTIRTIEKESGDDKRGPALVVTLGGPVVGTAPSKSGRYKFPEVGLGVTSLPVPQRVSFAMELVKQGWLLRGNIVFANEADASEFVQTVQDAQQRIVDSHVLSALVARQHALNTVKGLSLERTGARVSYATSLSISDARAVLAAVAGTLGDYFGQP